MAILVFLDFRCLLYEPGLAKRLNLFDYLNAFGLKPLVEYTYRFLFLYIVIIGGFLVFYALQDLAKEPSSLKTGFKYVVWTLYCVIPFYSYFTTLRPVSLLVHRRQVEDMNEIAEKMAKSKRHL